MINPIVIFVSGFFLALLLKYLSDKIGDIPSSSACKYCGTDIFAACDKTGENCQPQEGIINKGGSLKLPTGGRNPFVVRDSKDQPPSPSEGIFFQ